ncbi:lysozyme inhibitor LprI family protein [Stenotrophomonas sp. LGBM10]|uniref:lysozyme inhibitor LprI family protein n=1 Tax=Stenotrophomonas sp. LGBM10 TaxID=3390038 RepID=UPI00398B3FED
MSMTKVVLSGMALSLLLAGCGQGKAPACGDDSTLDLVRSIIQRELGTNSAAASLDAAKLRDLLQISLAHPTGFDEAISRYTCEADLVAPFNNPRQDVYKLRLQYTSQSVDGQQLVEVSVLPGDLMGIGSAIRTSLASSEATQDASSRVVAAPVDAAEDVVDPLASAKADDYADEAEVEPPAAADAVANPSFDCAKASSRVEAMICADAELAALDRETADTFRNVRANAVDAGALSAAQGQWRREVRDACADADCIGDAYRARLAELE